jgi:hypothetical protein
MMTTPATAKAGMRLSSIARIISRATTARIIVISLTTKVALSRSIAMRQRKRSTARKYVKEITY